MEEIINMKKENSTEKLLTGNIVSTMISLSLPAIIGMVVIGLYNFMDAVFVGQMVGPQAMTAVKVSYPFTLINSGISTLIGVGSASVLSRAIGKKDSETVDQIMGNLTGAILLLSIIVTVLGLLFTKPLISLSGATGETLDLAVTYMRIVFVGSLFVNFAQSANMIMRGQGILGKAMMIMGMGAVLNIILDPILINIMNSSGEGVKGAAYATIISQIVQAVVTLVYFLTKSTIKIHNICIRKNIMKEVLSIGVSAMLMQVMQMVQQTLMYHVAQNCGGSQWQTILGAALSLQAFAFIPLWGISQGFQPAIGTNYGAKNFQRVGQFTKAFFIGASLLALLFYVPIMCAPATMLSFFITDKAIVATGAPMLRLFFSTYITYGVMILSITFFQAIGKGGNAAILTLCRQMFFYIPLLFILSTICGITGLFLAGIVTDLAVLVISLCMVIKAFGNMKASIGKVVYES